MKLSQKTATILLVSFGFLYLTSLKFYKEFVFSEFLHIEEESASRNAQRVSEALFSELEQMRVTATDWAQWNDMYDYMKTRSERFEESWSLYLLKFLIREI